MISLNEKTTGHIVGPDGSLLQRPTTIIGATTAQIIRAYFLWAMQNQLEPELFCGDCFDHTRQAKATYNINDAEIEIVCACRMLIFIGPSQPGETIAASQTAPHDGAGAAQVQLSGDAARLLRLYKKVLIELNLKEALRCNACYELQQPDGCAAQVLSNSIQIRCRCSNRNYVGMTI